MDVVATAIRFGATVYDLEGWAVLRAAYSSRDGQHALSAEEHTLGLVDNIVWRSLDLPADTVLLDVRTPAEVAMGAIPGSVNIPVDSLRGRLGELDKSKAYVVYCAVGVRAHVAARILLQNGFERVRNLAGGYTTYRMASRDYSTPPEKADKEGERGVNEDNNVSMGAHKDGRTIEVNACGLQCPVR